MSIPRASSATACLTCVSCHADLPIASDRDGDRIVCVECGTDYGTLIELKSDVTRELREMLRASEARQ